MYRRAATSAFKALTVSGVAPGHGFDALTGLPENGSTVPPSSTRSNQRVSLSCWLSARSPVVIAKPSFARLPPRPRCSLVRLAFMLRTVWSKICRSSVSCGRHEEETALPAGSRKSTRAGDISSAICGSVSWPKNASERRSDARSDDGRADGWRRIPWSSPARARSVWKPPLPVGRIVCSVVDLPAGSASATGAVSASRARAPRTAERADMAGDASTVRPR